MTYRVHENTVYNSKTKEHEPVGWELSWSLRYNFPDRGTCSSTHYVRVDFLERVVLGEIRRLNHSIEQQRQRLLGYAREMGYTCIAAYIDNGYSGLDPHRPGLVRLNADIAAGSAKAVLVTDPSRIWRDMAKCSEWLDQMDRQGVTVYCADTPEWAKLA